MTPQTLGGAITRPPPSTFFEVNVALEPFRGLKSRPDQRIARSPRAPGLTRCSELITNTKRSFIIRRVACWAAGLYRLGPSGCICVMRWRQVERRERTLAIRVPWRGRVLL